MSTAYAQLTKIILIVISVAIVMISATLHEISHGYVAYKLGDPTAKLQGRLTLNPLAHIDPIGSFALPLVLALARGPIFAFAKPVPYNPRFLKNPQRDELLVALAGPVCNLMLALIGAGLCHLIFPHVIWTDYLMSQGWSYWVVTVLLNFCYINLVLCFFNLIPLPPLDGSKILSPFLKGEARLWYYKIQHYSMPILLILLFVLPSWLNIDPLSSYLDLTAGRLFDFLLMGL